MFVLNDSTTFAFAARQDDAERQRDAAPMTMTATAAATTPQGEPAATAAEVDDLTARIQTLARDGGLTPRETEVFDLLARGRSIPYVRDALVISKETAATHAKHVYAKLDVHTRQELIDLVH